MHHHARIYLQETKGISLFSNFWSIWRDSCKKCTLNSIDMLGRSEIKSHVGDRDSSNKYKLKEFEYNK